MVIDNQWQQIFDKIGEAASWEMLAEEAAELSAAASKVSRILRGDNPTRTDYETAVAKAVEELSDTQNAMEVLDVGLLAKKNRLCHRVWESQPRKMTRWYHSLFGGDA